MISLYEVSAVTVRSGLTAGAGGWGLVTVSGSTVVFDERSEEGFSRSATPSNPWSWYGVVRTWYRLLVAGRGRPRFVGHYRPLFRGHCGHPSPDRRPILLRCGAESARDGETVDGVVPGEARRFLSDPSRGEQYFEVASDHSLGEANASGKVFLTRIRTGSVAVGVFREGVPDGHR